jgi:hypothetical protein
MLGPQLPAPSGQNSASDHLKGKARDGGAHRDSSKRGGSYLTSELWEKKLERLLRGTQEKKKRGREDNGEKDWAKDRREMS